MANEYLDKVGLTYFWGKLKAYFQVKLVSGTNIKTINNESLLGSGNITIQGGGGSVLDFYPVGSYYETSDTSFNPNTSWGGTWILETEGQVHVSAGSNYTIAGALTDTSDGGSEDAIIPYHNHSVNAVTSQGMSANTTHSHTIYGKYKKTCANGSSQNRVDGNGSSQTSGPYSASSANLAHTHTVPAHNTNYVGTSGEEVGANMQPYIVVNRWHRTA